MTKTYKNGNTIVSISDDGTKVRYVPDNAPAMPVYPESIDMKISNRCEMGCAQCHEQSTATGKQANLKHPLLDSLHPYTELAIGGGDPLTHPDLEEFLVRMKAKQVISNITVHWQSFLNNRKTLLNWIQEGLIHGLGVSINEVVPCEVVEHLTEIPTAVVHTIVGIANEGVFRQLADRYLNILLLGYKTFGRGIKYRTDNSLDIAQNAVWVQQHLNEFTEHFRAVSFDNLAIEQTGLKKKLAPDLFNEIYMGGDGSFTMYVDLVENKYAKSSTSKRFDIDSNNIDELFANVRKKAGYA